jgi:tRNA(His) 5'-end guanylyltransferase
MKDELGDRMKSQYEDRTRFSLPRRTYTIIRLDGKAFHTYTRGLKKPFDRDLYEDMDNAIIAMLPEIQGAVFAYTQSDEISILLTDFALPTTSAWFDANLQKMCSVGASIITAEFNRVRMLRHRPLKCPPLDGSERLCLSEVPMAYFDARVFTIPDRTEVMNYFIWRNQDCSRNSVSMVAQQNFSHTELQGVSTTGIHDMLHAKGINWATDFSDGEKNGRLIVKESYLAPLTPPQNTNGKVYINATITNDGIGAMRTRWVSKGAWRFTENKEKLLDMVPKYEL